MITKGEANGKTSLSAIRLRAILAQGQRALIVLGPSSSGKSFMAEHFPNTFVDGDDVIKRATGWPPGRWWETSAAEQIHARNERTLRRHATVLPHRIILFNGRFERPADGYWIPTDEELKRNAERKKAEQAEGRKLHQPASMPELLRNREGLRRAAVEADRPILSTQDLLALVG